MDTNKNSFINLFEYYTQQSVITDPEEYGVLFNNMPDDINAIWKIIRGFMVQYEYTRRDERHRLAKERYNDIYLREVKKMLQQAMELDNSPLYKPRDIKNKLFGNCRDFIVVLCSVLRHKKISCRVRYCFANYSDYDQSFYFDHTLLECWDKTNSCWNLVDMEEPGHINQPVSFNLWNIPRNMVVTSSQAWLMCRNGETSPHKFGNGYINRRSGLWYIRNSLLRDLASLNKKEMLSIDAWGSMLQLEVIEENEIALLDKVAQLLENVDQNFFEILSSYKETPALQAPSPEHLKYLSLFHGIVDRKYVPTSDSNKNIQLTATII